jgi:small subunit ribosomal protein S1
MAKTSTSPAATTPKKNLPPINTAIPAWAKEFDVSLTDKDDDGVESEFSQLLKENQKYADFKEGDVFKGTIITITDDFVTVDIGYKQEGLVFTREFRNYDGSLKVKPGDVIEVYVERLESQLGNLVLSKDKAEIIKAWDRISEACEKGESVEGTVISKVKGGLSVDIGVKAFLPGSQIDIRATKNLDKYIGKTMEFKVIKFNKKRGNIVLSRRAILSEERGRLKEETLGQIQEGMVVKGVVKNITDYGAFIDLGGVDGLLHITDMSWGRVKHPSTILNIGDEIDVKILKYDSAKERVSLGLKQVLPNPWETATEKYRPGTKVTGEVVSVKDYGVFLELADGIEGLVHVSEMSWTQKLKSPPKEMNVGDKVDAVVIEVDTENKRISLGVKQLLPNPWDKIVEKYNVGQMVEGKVKAVVDFGVFIDLKDDIDALIHVSDFSWTRKNINPADVYKIGDVIKATVLAVDRDNQKFSLGIKQLEEDPWKKIDERLPVGNIIDGEVTRLTEFGAFVEVETGIEGLIHISELSEDRVEKASDVVNPGDKVKVMVVGIDKEAKKISLSVKAIDRENMEQYNKVDSVKAATLGDKFRGIDINVKK